MIKPSDEALEQMGDFVRTMHETSGLLAALDAGLSMAEAEEQVLDYVRQFVPEPRKAPLAGNTIGTDRAFLARDMPTFERYVHYRNVDVSSIKELVRRWYPRVYYASPAKSGNHRALADVQESIEELRYYREAVFVPPARPGQRHGPGDRRPAPGRADRRGGPRRATSAPVRTDFASARAGTATLHAASGCGRTSSSLRMVGVAQLVEHLVVVQVVAGSSPVTHPMSDVSRLEPVRLAAATEPMSLTPRSPRSWPTATARARAAADRRDLGRPGRRRRLPARRAGFGRLDPRHGDAAARSRRRWPSCVAGRRVAMVSGTNGKTTTTHFLAAAVRASLGAGRRPARPQRRRRQPAPRHRLRPERAPARRHRHPGDRRAGGGRHGPARPARGAGAAQLQPRPARPAPRDQGPGPQLARRPGRGRRRRAGGGGQRRRAADRLGRADRAPRSSGSTRRPPGPRTRRCARNCGAALVREQPDETGGTAATGTARAATWPSPRATTGSSDGQIVDRDRRPGTPSSTCPAASTSATPPARWPRPS